MAYLKISRYKREKSDYGEKYLIKSDIDLNVAAHETDRYGKFVITRNSEEIMEVRSGGYISYLGEELVNKIDFGFDLSLEGYPKGIIDVSRDFSSHGWKIALNKLSVAKISYSEGLLAWLLEICTQFKYTPYEDWICIEFDLTELDVDIGLGLLFLVFSRDLD